MGKNDSTSSGSSGTTPAKPAAFEPGYMTQEQITALYAPYMQPAVMPPSTYVPGMSGEFNYFPGSGPVAATTTTTPTTTTGTGTTSGLTQYTDLSKLLGLFHGIKHGKSDLSPTDIQGYGSQLTSWSGAVPKKLKREYNRYVDWYKGQTFADGGMASYASGGIASDNFRMLSGPGGPKEDKIPARINNTVEARLSDGEVVFPADAVRAAGQGDGTKGAQALMQLSNALRQSHQSHLEVNKVKGKKSK